MDLPRSSGVLLHITSLPSPYGMGDLGPGAYAFADFLAATHQRTWQLLPLGPIGYGYSPYASPSTFARNPLLISPQKLLEQRLLQPDDVADAPNFPDDRIDFERVLPYRRTLLERAFERFEHDRSLVDEQAFWHFCERNADWLDDYALFMTLKETYNDTAWTQWPEKLAKRNPDALDQARTAHERTIRMHQFWQFLFNQQWSALRAYCLERSIRLFGDLPIYVAHDSADVWAHPELFHLDDTGHPTVVAGVPPDYFSETGQRWGNPIYRWDVMYQNGYRWWTRRLETILNAVDMIRLDHFRGFEAYWEIPAHEETAVHGRWVEGPGAALFKAVEHQLGTLPLVAENLGIITPEVTALMDQFDFPGMAVLLFAFDGDTDSDYLPHNFERNLVAYTGTHDNDTVAGWWKKNGAPPPETTQAQAFARRYLHLDGAKNPCVHWAFIRSLMASVAQLTVIPLQDVLGLDNRARMNVPGTEHDNWSWRYTDDLLTDEVADRLRTLTQLYGRASTKAAPV